MCAAEGVLISVEAKMKSRRSKIAGSLTAKERYQRSMPYFLCASKQVSFPFAERSASAETLVVYVPHADVIMYFPDILEILMELSSLSFLFIETILKQSLPALSKSRQKRMTELIFGPLSARVAVYMSEHHSDLVRLEESCRSSQSSSPPPLSAPSLSSRMVENALAYLSARGSTHSLRFRLLTASEEGDRAASTTLGSVALGNLLRSDLSLGLSKEARSALLEQYEALLPAYLSRAGSVGGGRGHEGFKPYYSRAELREKLASVLLYL